MDQKQKNAATKAGANAKRASRQQAGAANNQNETASEFGAQEQANAATFEQAKQQAEQRAQQKNKNS